MRVLRVRSTTGQGLLYESGPPNYDPTLAVASRK
jgi:hypothetical protein